MKTFYVSQNKHAPAGSVSEPEMDTADEWQPAQHGEKGSVRGPGRGKGRKRRARGKRGEDSGRTKRRSHPAHRESMYNLYIMYF